MQQHLQQQFRQEEIITMVHWDKAIGEQVSTPYPKIGGRLRIAHETNDQLSISTQVISYDGQTAVVSAITTTDKGNFSGIAMASVERDAKIAPAILELAESRAIARSLRFCGIGVEYCGAEEISHLSSGGNGDAVRDRQHGQNSIPQAAFEPVLVPSDTRTSQTPNSQNNGHNDPSNVTGGRLSNKQLVYILRLGNGRGLTKKELDGHCIKVFGVATDFITKKEASTLIDKLNTSKEVQNA